MPDLNKFIEWVKEKPGRHVSIDIGGPRDNESIDIWVYDYEFKVGQYVDDVEEIDLEGEYRRKMERLYMEAKTYLEKQAQAN